MTKFICITFGPRNDDPAQFYNERTWWDRQSLAEKWGLQSLSIAGCFGYVVIEETEDSWEVVDELGAPSNAVSISCDRLGTYSVQPAPALLGV
ncbi:hypothetical protein SCREM1_143 [Synechococcus phage S-CREM1]|nr:hypothetical protein SCREM1_143 [Synechococcus phage S-CREM1]